MTDLPVAVVIVNPDSEVVFANPAAKVIFQWRDNEQNGYNLKKLLNNGESKKSINIKSILTGGKTRHIRTFISGLKGKRKDLSITAIPSKISGDLPCLELYIQELLLSTSDKNIQKASYSVDDILSMSNSAYWELDKSKSLLKISNEFSRLTGIYGISGYLSLADFLNQIPRKEDRENIEKGLLTLDGEENLFHTSLKIRRTINNVEQNRFFIFYAKALPLKESSGYYGIIQDISDFKKLEKEILKAKEKAEMSDRIKSHFLTNLSYELRTPMNAILGFTELLNVEDLSKEQKLDYYNIIRSKGTTLLAKIDEVIELSKFETGNISINKTEFSLYPLLNELYEQFKLKLHQLSKDHIKLVLKLPEGHINEVIFTDPGRLQQMLSNLLNNAIQYTESGEIEFGYRKSGKFFKFYVSDTGIGINEEDQGIIFNRFHVIEDTSSRKKTGTGLNLTITKHIVELLGGKIKVKSEINTGSKFQISIPIEWSKRKKTDMREFEDLNQTNWKDRVFIIAEDEELNYKFLEAVLSKTQAKILRAKTGIEAVELCKNISKIDLVLMDIKMPQMNGYVASQEIKKFRPSVPIIAQTAFATQDEIFKCKQAGCDDVITKPIDIGELMQMISEKMYV